MCFPSQHNLVYRKRPIGFEYCDAVVTPSFAMCSSMPRFSLNARNRIAYRILVACLGRTAIHSWGKMVQTLDRSLTDHRAYNSWCRSARQGQIHSWSVWSVWSVWSSSWFWVGAVKSAWSRIWFLGWICAINTRILHNISRLSVWSVKCFLILQYYHSQLVAYLPYSSVGWYSSSSTTVEYVYTYSPYSGSSKCTQQQH